ncbi:SAM and SH3 domain-containing protein 1 [Acromyrmex echinatior]|uniref:SAM and SH3 domain-containing protein 1 n=1 Tax=Acromyrmex echinatior TaxID=103372 RepID=F4WXU4_ACREC|nr:SAM and SH3 domain-containing protein 1 [Acromyrmex echinatior]
MGHTILRSMVDPRDYDRLRYLQMNGGQPNSFEETIHRILRDIRQGLMQLGRDGRGQLPGDDTYMYDEDARCGGAGSLGPGPGGHWYDEPPYESDPEDFLMGASGGPVPTATIQNGRVCFTLNMRPENRGEGVISLRTAGDISLPRDRSRKGATSTMRGLIVPQGHNNPPTIIPLTHSRASRESGDYASSDVQSVSSRLSTVSVDTSRSDQPSVGGRHPDRPEHHHEHRHNHRHHHEHHHSVSPRPNQRHPAASTTVTNTVTDATSPQSNAQRRPVPRYSRSSGEEGLSPSQSSDYEDQEELESQHSAAVHTSEASALLEGDARAGIAGRARNLRHDVQRKISRLRQDRASSEAFPCSASSVESLPSGSGSSTQALVRAGSNHSSISCEDRDAVSPTSIGPVLCRARALVDYTPSPYDKDALKFKKGDVIDVVQMNKSGLWKGVVHNRIGHFKFINVEILNDRVPRRGEPERGKWGQRYRQKPGSVQELLQRMNLQGEREREREREREGGRESNISPRLEQTDSHLHGVECKVENLLLYISLFGVPIALPFPVPRHLFSRILPHHRISFPAYTLYNLQVPQTMTSPFCSIPSFLSISFSLSNSRFLSTPCSFLSSPAVRLGISFTSFWSFIFFLIYLQRSLYTKYPETALYIFPIANLKNQIIIKIGNCFYMKVSIIMGFFNKFQESK